MIMEFYSINYNLQKEFCISKNRMDGALKIAHFVSKWKGKADTIRAHCEIGASAAQGLQWLIEYQIFDIVLLDIVALNFLDLCLGYC